mmetsp:Transcript_41709/g.65116  ORF Transcript_41709/g.65116 Transcript_41709/m.65116 type:complete len:189 (+) Transcript_41709:46-612(+)|eukprot:CAMPEP_0184295192 /NCGR_PEP_ID=MMETSP1049-20130417/6127_1 /TAXON_ID=77928 /ORGANISM="Proteomonas sulcata, Strain CCMP704" /LENGTH=188 /DNA_ID=CAMNT_0026603645 /DNA_START=46 /DNA_END=612 /DNA_ORIENTATION=-
MLRAEGARTSGFVAALLAIVLLGLVSVSRNPQHHFELEDEEGEDGEESLMHITDTPSRVPDIKRYGMGFNDRMGVKPLCTDITSKGGLVDCVDAKDVGLGGSVALDDGHCDAVCSGCAGGVLAGPSCDSCLCGVTSQFYASGTAPDDCQSVCYFCRTAMTSGYACSRCSCGLWPAPLAQNPLDNQLYY